MRWRSPSLRRAARARRSTSRTRSKWRRRRSSPRSSTSVPGASSRCERSYGSSESRCAMPPELTAAIVQDAETSRVLMLAWMDEEALRLTRETGEAHFFSRSRGRLWRKGETSGNALYVEELRDDCDGDAILLRVRPAGPTCHTGSLSCFAPWLWRRVAERAAERPEGSYVGKLVAEGPAAAARKVGEEGVEVAL